MLVKHIFSLIKVNQERVNNLFVQVQFVGSPIHGILLFYSGTNCQKG